MCEQGHSQVQLEEGSRQGLALTWAPPMAATPQSQQYHPLPPTTHVPGREGRRQPRASVTGHSLLPSGEMLLREGEVGTSAIHHQERAGYI